jgi:membrane associated rhomboid family serine protease
LNPIRKPFRYTYFNASLTVIALNVLVFVLTMLRPSLTGRLGISAAGLIGEHWFWQPLTYMFVHGGFKHIFFNMLALLFFAIPIERKAGSWEFLLYYLLCGVLNGLLSVGLAYLMLIITGNPLYLYIPLIGASGAVYSVLLAYAVFFPRSTIFIWGILPVPAPLLIVIYFVIEFVGQFTDSGGTAHFAHLFGLMIGWAYIVIRMGIHPIRVWKDAYRR